MTRWFEDIPENELFPLGSHTFSEEEIIRFGKQYDPQYFHVDPDAAKHSHFGGLIASGWHTVCVGQRLMIEALFAEEERLRALGEEPGLSGPSPGVTKMDFLAPVRPGDVVTYVLTVASKRPSNSLPGWGLLFNQVVATNQNEEPVYDIEIVSFSKLRDYKMSMSQKIMFGMMKIPGLSRLLKRR